jgi:hypothetical protein
MTDIDRSGYFEFDRVVELARRTRVLLDTMVVEGELPDGGAQVLEDETLPHLENVQSGFRGWLRTEGLSLDELRYLLLQLGPARVDPASTDAERLAAAAEADAEARLSATRGPRATIRNAEPWHLAALAHARLVLALLPRLAADDVRWPAGRPSYADIPTPRGPAELAERLAELERQLWLVVTGRAPTITDPALRRTYGFFDAAERLGNGGLGRVA